MSDKRPFTTLNPVKIKQDYPKTYKSIVDWLKKSATEGNVLNEEMIMSFMYGNPRFLYDYFDDMGLFILIDYSGKDWYHTIIEPDTTRTSYAVPMKDRKLIEELALEQAFKIKEAKL